ncbi:NAD(P)/FAD-dependent oxidoreductase [Marinobacter daepoensis]|uniref:NAD(P)/FAD-dependent oxidoreductase n=1 Tax=Marinobacter daepoensis TaxID=262077 RepID=UPI0004A3DA99|nr:FAD-dependent oxidoreductase [Marinobacter daepoensis]
MCEVTSDTSSIRSVAVIGSGLAGLTSAIMLGDSGHRVRVFEKSRGPGGRMASKRVTNGSADIGAQYFTSRNPGFTRFLDRWAGKDSYGIWNARFGFQSPERGWLAFPDEHRFVGMPRMTAITRALSAHVELDAGVRIARMSRDGLQWRLTDFDGKEYTGFDQVVITAPPAQAQDLLESSGLHEFADRLAAHSGNMLPCWAVAAHFAEPVQGRFDAMRPASEALFWLANNSSKPGREGAGQWWVLHATPEWTQHRLDDSPDLVARALMAEFAKLTGHQGQATDWVAHRWLYARSDAGDNPGCLYDVSLGIGVAGDWLAGGRVEGAWESANQLIRAMAPDGC